LKIEANKDDKRYYALIIVISSATKPESIIAQLSLVKERKPKNHERQRSGNRELIAER